jgi:hypothetical protein
MSIRMRIVWEVLEAAKSAGDATVIAACRAIINANRIGKRAPAEMAIVLAFVE